jgi:hypothetical protein
MRLRKSEHPRAHNGDDGSKVTVLTVITTPDHQENISVPALF